MSQTKLPYKIRKHPVTRPLKELKETENVSRSYPRRNRTTCKSFHALPIENDELFSPIKENINRDKSPGKRLCVDPPDKSTPVFISPHKASQTPLAPSNIPSQLNVSSSPPSTTCLSSNKTPNRIIKTPTKAGFKSPYKQKKVICNPASTTRTLFEIESVKKKGRLSVLTSSPAITSSPALKGAKKLMQSCATPSRLVGRDSEVETLETYLESHLTDHLPGSLYVSGAPGTGKSASIVHIITKLQKEHKFTTLNINCMTHGTPRLLYGEIAARLNCSKGTAAACKATITARSKKKMIVVVLDEIDQLESTGQTVLYTLFEWPALPNSRLILIGIANSLDLTDRALPRLQAKVSCQPTLLHFTPYTKDQIVSILKDRLKEIPNIDEVMDQSAIQFCARKVSAITGDIRKALDICRRAIELVECKQRTSEVTLKVTLPFISKVIQEVYGSKVTNQLVSSNAESTLPLQQQLLLCSVAMATAKKHGNKMDTVTMGKLHTVTTKVCQHRSLCVIGFSELVDMCSALESRGLVGIKSGKDKRQQKVSLQLQPSELEHALQDKTLLSSIMDNALKFIK